MSKWLLSAALVLLTGCQPVNNNFAGGGNGLDDTGPSTDTDDTGPDTTSECPPSFGEPAAAVDDYPGKGWVVEVELPFEEGSCDITEGEMYLEFDDGTGGTTQGGPYTIGFDAEDVYVDDYSEDEGAGVLFFAFTVDSSASSVDFTVWIEFGDGSSTEKLNVSVN